MHAQAGTVICIAILACGFGADGQARQRYTLRPEWAGDEEPGSTMQEQTAGSAVQEQAAGGTHQLLENCHNCLCTSSCPLSASLDVHPSSYGSPSASKSCCDACNTTQQITACESASAWASGSACDTLNTCKQVRHDQCNTSCL